MRSGCGTHAGPQCSGNQLATPYTCCVYYVGADYSARLAKRVVVALDVRSNDAGDLVVTKGVQLYSALLLLKRVVL